MAYWNTGPTEWVYEVFPLDTMTVDDSDLTAVIQLWQSKRTGTGLPAWRDFTLEDFASRYGWFAVYDIVPGTEFAMHCRLHGTELVDLTGIDITGRDLFDPKSGLFGDDHMFDPMDRDFYAFMAKERQIGISSGAVVWQHREYIYYKALLLPLADDHQNIDKFLLSASTPRRPYNPALDYPPHNAERR